MILLLICKKSIIIRAPNTNRSDWVKGIVTSSLVAIQLMCRIHGSCMVNASITYHTFLDVVNNQNDFKKLQNVIFFNIVGSRHPRLGTCKCRTSYQRRLCKPGHHILPPIVTGCASKLVPVLENPQIICQCKDFIIQTTG